MSGIFIHGMAMPDRCFSCPMNDSDCCGISRGSYIEYREVDVDVAINGRPDWCPLIPVPDHGDLIDRDASLYALGRIVIQDDLAYTIGHDMAKRFLEKAPTIIPATAKEGA